MFNGVFLLILVLAFLYRFLQRCSLNRGNTAECPCTWRKCLFAPRRSTSASRIQLCRRSCNSWKGRGEQSAPELNLRDVAGHSYDCARTIARAAFLQERWFSVAVIFPLAVMGTSPTGKRRLSLSWRVQLIVAGYGGNSAVFVRNLLAI